MGRMLVRGIYARYEAHLESVLIFLIAISNFLTGYQVYSFECTYGFQVFTYWSGLWVCLVSNRLLSFVCSPK